MVGNSYNVRPFLSCALVRDVIVHRLALAGVQSGTVILEISGPPGRTWSNPQYLPLPRPPTGFVPIMTSLTSVHRPADP